MWRQKSRRSLDIELRPARDPRSRTQSRVATRRWPGIAPRPIGGPQLRQRQPSGLCCARASVRRRPRKLRLCLRLQSWSWALALPTALRSTRTRPLLTLPGCSYYCSETARCSRLLWVSACARGRRNMLSHYWFQLPSGCAASPSVAHCGSSLGGAAMLPLC